MLNAGAVLGGGTAPQPAGGAQRIGPGPARWDPDFAGYHDGPMVGTYLALVAVTGLVAVVSAARGTRAALAGPAA